MAPVEEVAPCAVEAKIWRECLKEFDYGPDRPEGACEKSRLGYYACIKSWTNRTQEKPYSYTNFELPKACRHEAEVLHQCMMMSMFEVSHCQKEMTKLKKCASLNDKEVWRALQGDPALDGLNRDVDNSTGLKRLWYKAIGKL